MAPAYDFSNSITGIEQNSTIVRPEVYLLNLKGKSQYSGSSGRGTAEILQGLGERQRYSGSPGMDSHHI